jgi:predicted small lipoprotein YifL
MAKPLATLLLALFLASAPACGRKGPLELPPGRAPKPVEGLAAVPDDGAVLLRWMNPVQAVSGRSAAPLEAVEIWVFEAGPPAAGRPLAADEVQRSARLVRRITRREFGAPGGEPGAPPGAMSFAYAVPSRPDAPARLAFTVRVIDRAGRASAFAAPVTADIARKDAGTAPGVPRDPGPGGRP